MAYAHLLSSRGTRDLQKVQTRVFWHVPTKDTSVPSADPSWRRDDRKKHYTT